MKFDNQPIPSQQEVGCSPLFRIIPYGAGTSDIMAFSDYIAFLARCHHVLPHVLLEEEVLPLINQNRLKTGKLRFSSLASSTFHPSKLDSQINGLSTTTRDWVDALSSLTRYTGLSHTTMVAFSNLISARYLLHPI